MAREHLLFRKEAAPRKQSLIWLEIEADFQNTLKALTIMKEPQ